MVVAVSDFYLVSVDETPTFLSLISMASGLSNNHFLECLTAMLGWNLFMFSRFSTPIIGTLLVHLVHGTFRTKAFTVDITLQCSFVCALR
jgi:hypothetical protein